MGVGTSSTAAPRASRLDALVEPRQSRTVSSAPHEPDAVAHLYLRRLQQGREDVVDVDQLIFSEKFEGERTQTSTFATAPPLHGGVVEQGDYTVAPDAPESVHTLVARYGEIDGLFPEELKADALPFFIDWLKDRCSWFRSPRTPTTMPTPSSRR